MEDKTPFNARLGKEDVRDLNLLLLKCSDNQLFSSLKKIKKLLEGRGYGLN